MKLTSYLISIGLLSSISTPALGQVYEVKQTEFGDPKFSDKDVSKDAIIRRDPTKFKELIVRERSTRTVTYKLVAGQTQDGKRGLYYEHPSGFDRTGPPGRRVIIFHGDECLLTRGRGVELSPLNRASYLSSPIAQLFLFSTWNSNPVTMGESGLLTSTSDNGVITTVVWKREQDQLTFREFYGADVLLKLSTVASMSLDRKRGEWTFHALGRDIRRFEYRIVDAAPQKLPLDVISLGTDIFDLRENGTGGVIAQWSGVWPKSIPKIQPETTQGQPSTAGMALQGVAVTFGVCLLAGGVRTLFKRRG